jgi:hypothetical protein
MMRSAEKLLASRLLISDLLELVKISFFNEVSAPLPAPPDFGINSCEQRDARPNEQISGNEQTRCTIFTEKQGAESENH